MSPMESSLMFAPPLSFLQAIDVSTSYGLIADSVSRYAHRHLFHLYSLLCEIACVPRKPPTPPSARDLLSVRSSGLLYARNGTDFPRLSAWLKFLFFFLCHVVLTTSCSTARHKTNSIYTLRSCPLPPSRSSPSLSISRLALSDNVY